VLVKSTPKINISAIQGISHINCMNLTQIKSLGYLNFSRAIKFFYFNGPKGYIREINNAQTGWQKSELSVFKAKK